MGSLPRLGTARPVCRVQLLAELRVTRWFSSPKTGPDVSIVVGTHSVRCGSIRLSMPTSRVQSSRSSDRGKARMRGVAVAVHCRSDHRTLQARPNARRSSASNDALGPSVTRLHPNKRYCASFHTTVKLSRNDLPENPSRDARCRRFSPAGLPGHQLRIQLPHRDMYQ